MSNLNVKNIVHPTSGDTTPTENLSKQVCKAWVNFNGTGTVAIRDSYNVSSITDNGVGNYTVNFAQAMSNTNYVPALLGTTYSTINYTTQLDLIGSVTTGASLKSVNAMQVAYTNSGNPGTKYDASECNVQIFGS